MDNKENKTTLIKKEAVKREWFILDATGKTLGRFASEVSKILRGKHRPDYTPYVDSGDGVIVINADKIHVTGSKRVTKIYRYYTGAMSGLREVPFDVMQARKPGYILEHAIYGMLPKTRLAKG
ncbi:MAG: rl13, partial [Chlamydiia bacterium]|nr:rl13 [Chlamydiia bacterium]